MRILPSIGTIRMSAVGSLSWYCYWSSPIAFPFVTATRRSLSSSLPCFTTASSSSFTNQYATNYHAPVMVRECMEAVLASGTAGRRVYVDATLGGGGHSQALLERMSKGDLLIGCDVDPEALSTAKSRLFSYICEEPLKVSSTGLPVFVPVLCNFKDLASVVPRVLQGWTDRRTVDAVLADLGVSSHQIDDPTRGFAFMGGDGPLDMRMNGGAAGTMTGGGGGMTAADLCNTLVEGDLATLLKRHADEPRARAVAAAVIRRRPLFTTSDLAAAVADVTPEFAKSRRMGRRATTARVFQAVRIAVNSEDEALQTFLRSVGGVVESGNCTDDGGDSKGRLVVLTYHSNEDRAVKRLSQDRRREKDLYGNPIGKPPSWRAVGKPRTASEEEVAANPRARSATLRVVERRIT